MTFFKSKAITIEGPSDYNANEHKNELSVFPDTKLREPKEDELQLIRTLENA